MKENLVDSSPTYVQLMVAKVPCTGLPYSFGISHLPYSFGISHMHPLFGRIGRDLGRIGRDLPCGLFSF